MINLKNYNPEHCFTIFDGFAHIWQELTPYIKTRIYQKDETIILHGDAANCLWLVFDGWVKLSRQTPDGKETIIDLCNSGDIFGEACLCPKANYSYNAEIVSQDAELAAIPAEIIRELIKQHYDFSINILLLLNNRVTQAQLKMEQISTLSAAQRLSCFLISLCKGQQYGERNIQIPIEKHILASYLCMKSETFSRALQQLKTLGISVSGNNITISNIANLRNFVCGNCSEAGLCKTDIKP